VESTITAFTYTSSSTPARQSVYVYQATTFGLKINDVTDLCNFGFLRVELVRFLKEWKKL